VPLLSFSSRCVENMSSLSRSELHPPFREWPCPAPACGWSFPPWIASGYVHFCCPRRRYSKTASRWRTRIIVRQLVPRIPHVAARVGVFLDRHVTTVPSAGPARRGTTSPRPVDPSRNPLRTRHLAEESPEGLPLGRGVQKKERGKEKKQAGTTVRGDPGLLAPMSDSPKGLEFYTTGTGKQPWDRNRLFLKDSE